MRGRLGRLIVPMISLAGAPSLQACVGDECDDGAVECEGSFAMYCGVAHSDAHKSGNPYVWHQKADCGKPELCKMDTHGGRPGAFCVMQAEPLRECTQTGFLCLPGDKAVDCTDSHYGSAVNEGDNDPFSCGSCRVTEGNLVCIGLRDANGFCPPCDHLSTDGIPLTEVCVEGESGAPGSKCGCASSAIPSSCYLPPAWQR